MDLFKKRLLDTHNDDMEELAMVAQVLINRNAIIIEDIGNNRTIDHRSLPRKKRTKWNHDEALHCINRDFLGPIPKFPDKQFDVFFRMSKSRFELIMQAFGNSGDPFYNNTQVDAVGRLGASLEARLLLPIKTLAYGVPPHTFTDYFQMSFPLARECCLKFSKMMKKLFQKEFLRLPSKQDLKGICALHKAAHKIDGMFGSLDCMHTYWKNCPVAWQGSYKGKEKKSTVVLEAIADYNLWFWHASYGYAGTLNDNNILNLSPLLESIVTGKFAELESEVTPYKILEEEFKFLFILVDGIYPRYARFVKGQKEPITNREKCLSEWQESARKDIERAFGVLQAKWQFVARPIHLHALKDIATRVASCLILHNMCVCDRVMGEPGIRYNPAHNIEEMDGVEATVQPPDLQQVQGGLLPQEEAPMVGIGKDKNAVSVLTRRKHWNDLKDLDEHIRLHAALMERFEY